MTLRTYDLKRISRTSIYVTIDLRAHFLLNAGIGETAGYHRKGCLHMPDKEQKRQMGSYWPMSGVDGFE
jgi:hypothetical protein